MGPEDLVTIPSVQAKPARIRRQIGAGLRPADSVPHLLGLRGGYGASLVIIFHFNMASSSKTQSNRKQPKRSCPDSAGSSDEETEHFARWLVIQSRDDNRQSLDHVSPFAIGKSLKCQIGTLDTVKRLQRGDLLVQTSNRKYSEMLLGMTSLADVPVKVSPHRSLNSSKGVVRSRDLARCGKDEIVNGLKNQGVTDAVVISVKNGSERRITNTVILTFNTPQPPQHVTAGYLRIPVAVYIPNPLRCYQCQKFGHGRSHCKGQQTCARCGETGHDDTQCQKVEHCVNCNGDHPASSKACPKWKLEQRVQQIRAEKSVSFIEARKLATAEQKPSTHTTLASVISSKSQRQLKSVEVQTDLTWPAAADEPIQVSQTRASKATATASTSTAVFEDAGSADDEKARKGGKGKTGHPKITRPPPTPNAPVTDANRYAVLGTSPMEEGDPSSSVIT